MAPEQDGSPGAHPARRAPSGAIGIRPKRAVLPGGTVIRLTLANRQTIDPVLIAFISAEDELTSDQLLEQIMLEEADPLIKSIVGSKLQVSPVYRGAENEKGDVDDVCGEVTVRLVKRLRELKAQPNKRPVS